MKPILSNLNESNVFTSFFLISEFLSLSSPKLVKPLPPPSVLRI